jgi:hypothetical protein
MVRVGSESVNATQGNVDHAGPTKLSRSRLWPEERRLENGEVTQVYVADEHQPADHPDDCSSVNLWKGHARMVADARPTVTTVPGRL